MPAPSSTLTTDDAIRRGLRSTVVAGGFLVAVVFLPWQLREVDVRAEDPIPMSFRDRAELQHDISDAKIGEFMVPGYDARKATPFGDGVLVGALGAAAAIAGIVAVASRRWLRSALIVMAGGSLTSLVLGVYDAFTYNILDDWSSRDWHVWWAKNNEVNIQTQPALGLFLMLAIATYLAWRSISMIRRMGMSEPASGPGLTLPSSPGAGEALT